MANTPRQRQLPEPPSPPVDRNARLGEAESRHLLALADMVRDPIHGDIWITKLERRLIDTPEVQRLRNLMQLGLTHIVYPGAVHTRFQHSLGALHVCSELISTCNSNAQTYGALAPANHSKPVEMTGYTTLLARLCALLHDLAHVPYGHTFDKEAQIFQQDEWQDPWRVGRVFGKDSTLVRTLRAFLREEVTATDTVQDRLLLDIQDVLKAKEQAQILDLPFPFVHDLVGNTICADLIDYVRRDMYFSGLRENFGDRFLQFIAAFPVKAIADPGAKQKSRRSKASREDFLFHPIPNCEDKRVFPSRTDGNQIECCRIVLMRYRYNEKHVAVPKYGVFNEAIDLVRRRLNAAEKLYYHRTKIVASAMLADAAYEEKFQASDIWEKSDREVLLTLASSKNLRASSLAKKLLDRHLFKSIYRIRYKRNDDEYDVSAQQLESASRKFSSAETRRELLLQLERIAALLLQRPASEVAGAFSMCCPRDGGDVKEFDMLVLTEPTASGIRRLQVSQYRPTQLEIEAIQEAHAYLWALEVFVDPDIVPVKDYSSILKKLVAAIERTIGPPNDIVEFRFSDIKTGNLDYLERECLQSADLKEMNLDRMVTKEEFEELISTSHRSHFPLNKEQRQAGLRAALDTLKKKPE